MTVDSASAPCWCYGEITAENYWTVPLHKHLNAPFLMNRHLTQLSVEHSHKA